MASFFDAHTHLHDKAFDPDREEILARMREQGVSAITVGTNLETSRAALALAEAREGLWASIGLHPNDNKDESFDATAYETLMRSKKAVAVGECGLDYYRGGETDKHRQKNSFEAQVAFAVAHDKSLMIHCRDAHDDAIELLTAAKKKYGDEMRGVIHFFTAGPEIARRYLELGFHLSYPGVITFTDMYDESVRVTPLERLFSETDAPYAAPAPHRGKRNEPSYVRCTLGRLAELKGLSEEDLSRNMAENAEKLFGILLVA